MLSSSLTSRSLAVLGTLVVGLAGMSLTGCNGLDNVSGLDASGNGTATAITEHEDAALVRDLDAGLRADEATLSRIATHFGYPAELGESAFERVHGWEFRDTGGESIHGEGWIESDVSALEVFRVTDTAEPTRFLEIAVERGTRQILSAGERTAIADPPVLPEEDVDFLRAGATFKWPWDKNQGTWQLTDGYDHCTCAYHACDFNRPSDLGRRVLNSARGIVQFVGWRNGYGWCAEMNHGSGRWTRVAHLKYNPNVHSLPGFDLLQGTKLGECGQSGNATGPHIHFEYWKNGASLPFNGFSGYSQIVVGAWYNSDNSYVAPPMGS